MVFEPTMVIAMASLIGLVVVTAALLRAWHDWLELKRAQLERTEKSDPSAAPLGAARIEISDLKERIRKLEAIASGVDL
ncbi:hypothetical protein [Qipengyuania atrilutea]|uniref:hypothetical protein n=1 Tax=Qipengyuania atrilutea TaxID=2744473 RepID=UPI001C3D66DD